MLSSGTDRLLLTPVVDESDRCELRGCNGGCVLPDCEGFTGVIEVVTMVISRPLGSCSPVRCSEDELWINEFVSSLSFLTQYSSGRGRQLTAVSREASSSKRMTDCLRRGDPLFRVVFEA